MQKTSHIAIVMSLLMFTGCAMLEGDYRSTQADTFKSDINSKTQKILASGDPLSLDDCIAIAIENSFAIRKAEIDRRLAALDKDIAFANFLPTITTGASAVEWRRQPASVMFGVMNAPMHDRVMRDASIDFQMSVLVPATWFLYSIRQFGEEISKYSEDYTRQMLALQITAKYYECLGMLDSIDVLNSQLEAIRTLNHEVEAMCTEGLLPSWQLLQTEALIGSQALAIRSTKRSLVSAKAELLMLMGLAPDAELQLKVQTPMRVPDATLDELIYEALLSNPRLHIADRQVVIQEEAVKIAISEFLPKVAAFSTLATTSNSLSAYASSWNYGLSGVMTLFNGFANVNQYRQAKEKKALAYIQREELSLSFMVQVQDAYLNVLNADELRLVAEKNLMASQAQLREIQDKGAEGLVLRSDRITLAARTYAAEMDVNVAEYRHQLSTAVLLNALGASYTVSHETEYAQESSLFPNSK